MNVSRKNWTLIWQQCRPMSIYIIIVNVHRCRVRWNIDVMCIDRITIDETDVYGCVVVFDHKNMRLNTGLWKLSCIGSLKKQENYAHLLFHKFKTCTLVGFRKLSRIRKLGKKLENDEFLTTKLPTFRWLAQLILSPLKEKSNFLPK